MINSFLKRAKTVLIGESFIEALLIALGFFFLSLILLPFFKSFVPPLLVLTIFFLSSFIYRIASLSKVKVASRVENRYPVLNERLLSYVELEDAEDNFFKEKLREELEGVLKNLKPIRVFSIGGKTLKFALLSVVFFLLMFSLKPESYILAVSGEIEPILYVQPGSFRAFKGDIPTITVNTFGLNGKPRVLLTLGDKKEEIFTKDKKAPFHFRLPPLTPGRYFYTVEAGKLKRTFEFEVLEVPHFTEFKVKITYPYYAGIPGEEIQFPEYLSPLVGSRLRFNVKYEGADSLFVFRDDSLIRVYTGSEASFKFVARRKTKLRFKFERAGLYRWSLHRVVLDPVPDGPPSIVLIEPTGSLNVPEDFKVDFKGYTEDDFGLNELRFFYIFGDTVGKAIKEYQRGTTLDTFHYTFDLTPLSLLPGDEVIAYFEVEDAARNVERTREIVIRFPTTLELYEEFTSSAEEGSEATEELVRKAGEIEEKMRELEELVKEKKELDLSKKEKVKEILKREKELLKELEKKTEELIKAIENLESSVVLSPDILEKMEKIRELLEEVLPEELKQNLEKLQMALEKMDKEKLEEALRELTLNQEALRENLERMEEILERYREEMKFQELAERVRELEERQARLENVLKKENLKELAKKEHGLRQEMKEIRRETEELSKAIEREGDISDSLMDIGGMMKEVENQMKEVETSMAMGNMESLKFKMGKIRGEMKSIEASLRSLGQRFKEKRIAEVLKEIKNAFEGVMFLSEVQEDVIRGIEREESPLKLAEDEQAVMRGTEKSIEALKKISKKTLFVGPKQIALLKMAQKSMEKAKFYLESMNGRGAIKEAKDALFYINLALYTLLKSQSACKGAGSSTGAQEAMQNLEQALKMQAGLNNLTQTIIPLPSPSTEVLQELLKGQEAVRRLIEKARELLGDEGLSSSLKGAEEESKKAEDLIKEKKINEELLKRQRKVLDRLLQAQRSIRKREFTRKRESTPGKAFTPVPPARLEGLEERERIRQALKELKKKGYPPHIKRLIEAYFRSLLE